MSVVFFPDPPKADAKPTDLPAAPSLNFTVARTQAPTSPPTTLAPTVIPVTTTTTTITTTTSPAGEEDVQLAGPNATMQALPVPAAPPAAPTDALQAPPSTEPPPIPTPAGGDNGTAALDLDTPTPETNGEEYKYPVETETTTEPGMDFTSNNSPHGECCCIFRALRVCLFSVKIKLLLRQNPPEAPSP